MTRIFLLTLTLLFSACSTHAQSPLSGSQVDRFLNTLDKLSELPDLNAETIQDPTQMDTEELARKMRAPFGSTLPEMRSHELFAEGLAMIKSEGFSDETEWADVGDRVMRAYAALRMDSVETAMDEELAKALEELEESDLPEEMKQKMRKFMKVAQDMAQEIEEVPQADIDAVRPFTERFERIAEESARYYQN